jgi:hypothetical protein
MISKLLGKKGALHRGMAVQVIERSVARFFMFGKDGVVSHSQQDFL